MWGIRVVNHYVPLNFTCLVQAISAKRLLKNHPDIHLCVGVRKSASSVFSAHAWLVYQQSVVLGEWTDQSFETILEWA